MGLPTWRAMHGADLDAVVAVADRVHPDHPEDINVFRERLHLYPQGCFVLSDSVNGILGYAITHPWHRRAPPALNARLGAIPTPSTYYIHDIALLPAARGMGASAHIVAQVVGHAQGAGCTTVALVAIPGLAAYWAGSGFVAISTPDLAVKLQAYGPGSQYMERQI